MRAADLFARAAPESLINGQTHIRSSEGCSLRGPRVEVTTGPAAGCGDNGQHVWDPDYGGFVGSTNKCGRQAQVYSHRGSYNECEQVSAGPLVVVEREQRRGRERGVA